MGQGIGYKDGDGSYGFKLTDDGKVILGNTSDDVIQITGTLDVNGSAKVTDLNTQTWKDSDGNTMVSDGGTDLYFHRGTRSAIASFYIKDSDGDERVSFSSSGDLILNKESGTSTQVTGTLDVNGTLLVNQYIKHNGDSNTYMDFPSNDNITFAAGGSEELKITDGAILVKQYIKHDGDENTHMQFADNKIILKAGNLSFFKADKKDSAPHEITLNDGSNNIDFVVKGNGSNEGNPLFMCDASTGRVGINGVGSPSYELDVDGTIASNGLIVDTDTLYVDSTNNRVGIGTTNPAANLTIEGDHDGGTVSLRMGANGDVSNYSSRLEMAEDCDGSRVMTYGSYLDYDGDAVSPDFGMLKIGMRDNSTSDTDVVKISRKADANTFVLGDTSAQVTVSGEIGLTSSGGNITLDSTGNDINLNGTVVIGASYDFNVASTAAFTGTTNMSSLGIGTASPQIPLDIYNGSSLISQTIIDGKSTTFSCETSSTTYKQINDDTSSDKIASITFTVPASRKVLVTMRAPVRDFDSSSQLFRVRITDSNSESTEGSWGSDFNDEQISGHYATDFFTHTFQWYFDGSAAPHNWSSGDSKTMYFQLKVDGSSETVSVKAGNGYAPMSITAESVPNNVTHVDMG